MTSRSANIRAAKKDSAANILGSSYTTPMAGSNTSVMTFGGPAFNTTFLGIIPEYNEALLTTYYRDCYYFDNVAGAMVDIISNMPFSDVTLAGVENKNIAPFRESLTRLNFRTLMQEISMTHLVDGAFIGSLVYDFDHKVFQDVLIHDFVNSSITPQPFYSLDPVISVNSANALNQFLNSGSPFLTEALQNYPKQLLETFSRGSAVLDPLATLYIPRKGMRDRTSVSYLKRLLPVYMLEKTLYRGTLTEAMKRQRSTSHIQIGDENWEPTDAEMYSILSDFQRSEDDPLGAWIATRRGVDVNEVRPGGDFWKWTDTFEQLTPFKLRALGTSEAFLSGDASFATAEAAVSSFLDNLEAYRSFLTYKTFTTKILPMVAVFNGLYKDPTKARRIESVADLAYNLSNSDNLILPELRWHKSLEGRDKDSEFDMLEKLSEKGYEIPMKMWAAAAGVNITTMLSDLEEDAEIRKKIKTVMDKSGLTTLKEQEDEEAAPEEEGGSPPEDMRFSAIDPRGMGARPASVSATHRKMPLLAREFNNSSLAKLSKSGNKVHAMVDSARSTSRENDLLYKVTQSLKDPERRAQVRKSVREKLGASYDIGLVRK
jgi:hypothetical protein